jgi:hypothetical protein
VVADHGVKAAAANFGRAAAVETCTYAVPANIGDKSPVARSCRRVKTRVFANNMKNDDNGGLTSGGWSEIVPVYVVHAFSLGILRSASDINFGLWENLRFVVGATYLGEVVCRIKAKGIRFVSCA